MADFNIQTLIDSIIQKNSQYKSLDRTTAKFNISDAGGCYRARIYKRVGVEPTRIIEIQGLRKMCAGDAGHEKLQQLLWRGKKMFMSENEVESEHLLGHPDGIIKHEDTKYLVEFKTIEKFQAGYIKKQGAKREHQLQMFTYWSLLRRDLKDLDRAVLSYVKREDFETNDYYFNWSDQIQEQVNNEWNPLIDTWNRGVIPACTCSEMYNGNGIKYCRYAIDENTCCDESLYTDRSKLVPELALDNIIK